ncbi:hypothetical protein HPB50_019303 [Hyalomma asiaticum]|uniref:Uncharacterized protein n=1 Tax=Hyalomma asiaticum TaxID=266040 RepID=A0ACB7T2U6_HYAAI|nr:hypothetical protein HPB50_019303 [Hyalomma asiaticum]
MVSVPRRKRRRKDALFPTVSHGSRSVSGSAMTSSTTTRDSPLGILRNVPFAPQFLRNRRGQALCKSWPALIILSAILLSSVLAAHILLAKTRPQGPAVCRTKPCLDYARLLAASVNTSLDPCMDFTRFVCSGWRRNNKLSVQETWMMFDLRRLYQTLRSVDVPRKQQTMLQRSAAFMRSCEAVRNGEMDEMPKWNSVLRVSIRRTPNTTVISLEPPLEFLYIVAKHQQREFYAVAQPPANESKTTVNFHTTRRMDIMYLGLLQTVMAFPSKYSQLDPAWLFGTVATLTRDRLMTEVDLMGESVSGDIVFASAKQPFVRLFLQLWQYRGERDMHLFLSWCTVQTVALYANRRLLVNFYSRETTVDLYHAALCLSKVYLLCGSEVFGKYFEEVLSRQGVHVAQRVVDGTLGEFASRLQRWQYRDENISLLEDWNTTDAIFRYFDPRFMSEGERQRAPDATCTRDMGDSLADNLRLASLGHVMEDHRWASELIQHADCYVRHGAADSAIRRVIEGAEKASRPRDPAGSDRVIQIIRTLAFDVSFEAYRAGGATALDEHLEGFERYGSAAMFFIASCYALCRGSDGFVPFTGVECDEPLRNIEGFGEAFACELGSAMNPVQKTILM